MSTAAGPAAEVEYPGSDGKPIADNTLQFQWIMTIQGNLDLLFADDPAVLVAGDYLVYPAEGNASISQAPDVYVAFGRPKGHRPSYKVWEEGGVFPQVVFEVLSPGNTAQEMNRKRVFYDRYGAEEYYILDPDDRLLEGWLWSGDRLAPVAITPAFVSPRLGIRFGRTGDDIVVLTPADERFLTFLELGEVQRRAVAEAALERQRADQERQRAAADDRATRLAARLRELGVDPDAV
jgi:Uma2 family endonuclease